jgi:hypothetical protein
MRKILLTTVAVATLLSAPAARANELGGLVGGLAGGLIAGAIIGSMQPHTVYVVPVRRHYYAAPARTRTVVVHDHTTVVRTVVDPAPAPVVVAAPQPVVVAAPAPAAPANNNNIVMAPAPAQAPVIINNTPAPAPAPIIINTAAPAPVAAPQVAATVSTACQEFTKTADYLACLKGTPVADATKN